MPEPNHTIRLRGPWNLVLTRAGTKVAGARMNVRPEDERWADSIQRALGKVDQTVLDFEKDYAQIDLELSRAFKWPNAIPSRIELCIDAESPFRVVVNDKELGSLNSKDEQFIRFDLATVIQERNQLAFFVDNLPVVQLPNQLRAARIEVWE